MKYTEGSGHGPYSENSLNTSLAEVGETATKYWH